MKSSAYYFHVKTRVWADFQICIDVPLKHILHDNSRKLILQKILKRKKFRVWFCLSLGHISVKNVIEKSNSVGAGAHKVGKVVSFWPNFDPSFNDIWRA